RKLSESQRKQGAGRVEPAAAALEVGGFEEDVDVIGGKFAGLVVVLLGVEQQAGLFAKARPTQVGGGGGAVGRDHVGKDTVCLGMPAELQQLRGELFVGGQSMWSGLDGPLIAENGPV